MPGCGTPSSSWKLTERWRQDETIRDSGDGQPGWPGETSDRVYGLAVLLGLLGQLCATAITVLGGFAVLHTLGMEQRLALWALFLLIGLCALLRGVLRYGEQTCNHFIAFKLLALLRDRVFAVLRRLCRRAGGQE